MARRTVGWQGGERELRMLHRYVNPVGSVLVEIFHLLGLFAIGAGTVWAAAHAFLGMFTKSHASVEDLLLLFIYLEIGAMVGVYFKTNHMPVRFLLYVAITAVTRHLIGFVNTHPAPDAGLMYLAGAVLVLALGLLVVRYASFAFGTAAMVRDGSDVADTDVPPARSA